MFGIIGENPKYDNVDKFVDIILAMCNKFNNKTKFPRTAEGSQLITRESVMEIIVGASENISVVADCQLGLFRLMIILHGCAHLGIQLKPGHHL